MKAKYKNEIFEKYVERLRQIPFQDFGYDWISCEDLEDMNRPRDFGILKYACEHPDLFEKKYPMESFVRMIGMEVSEYNVVLTGLSVLPWEIIENAPSYTMTEYRQWARDRVRSIIGNQIKECNTFIKTSVGDMRILKKPIILNVRTRNDMLYRQVGETTQFYMIGLFEDPKCRNILHCPA